MRTPYCPRQRKKEGKIRPSRFLSFAFLSSRVRLRAKTRESTELFYTSDFPGYSIQPHIRMWCHKKPCLAESAHKWYARWEEGWVIVLASVTWKSRPSKRSTIDHDCTQLVTTVFVVYSRIFLIICYYLIYAFFFTFFPFFLQTIVQNFENKKTACIFWRTAHGFQACPCSSCQSLPRCVRISYTTVVVDNCDWKGERDRWKKNGRTFPWRMNRCNFSDCAIICSLDHPFSILLFLLLSLLWPNQLTKWFITNKNYMVTTWIVRLWYKAVQVWLSSSKYQGNILNC